ncbi:MAG TPA: Pvc16 family protein [Solirubrobacterales bacterium]
MTDTWAIAAVTQSFTKLLERVASDDPSVSPLDVVAKPPDRVLADDGKLERRKLNLFLYQVSPNPALANADAPFRNADGELVAQPMLALDLHYLLTAYGAAHDELDAQHLLTHAMSLVHDNGTLRRADISAALAETPMGGSNLAEQLEGISLAPESLSDEELFRMWTVFGASYRISVGFVATVVMVERPKRARRAPPVSSSTLTAATLRMPVIEEIEPERPTAGATITVRGRNLAADEVTVRLASGDVTVEPEDLTDTEFDLTLPSGLFAGPNPIQVLHSQALADEPSETRQFASSDVFSFMLAPRITSSLPAAAPRGGTMTLTVQPPVRRTQRVVAMLGSDALLRRVAPGDPQTSSTVRFPIPADLDPGTRTLRVQVDGSESALEKDPEGVYSEPEVEVT